MSYNQTSGEPKPKQKRSGCVTLLLVGTVVSICSFGIYSCAKDDEVRDDEVTEIENGRSYPNNHYVPGVGYYHAPFGGFFPNQYNQYDASRGFYSNGHWGSTPDKSSVTSSVPSAETVSNVNSAWRSANPGTVASRKSSIASSRSSSRGGFGSSFRSSSS